jgi:hypothetical protein
MFIYTITENNKSKYEIHMQIRHLYTVVECLIGNIVQVEPSGLQRALTACSDECPNGKIWL